MNFFTRHRKDFQWFVGILLLPLIFATSALYTLEYFFRRDVAVPAITTGIALSFSPKGLDDLSGIEEIRQNFLATGEESVRPIPGLNLVLTRSEIQTLSPRGLRLRLFEQLAGPLYDRGLDAASELAPEGADIAQFKNDLGLLAVITAERHDQIAEALRISSIACFVLALLLLLLGKRFGRTASLGAVILMGSLPLYAVIRIVHSIAEENAVSSAGAVLDRSLVAANFITDTLGPHLSAVSGTLGKVSLFGVLLLVASFIGLVALIIWRRFFATQTESNVA